jgi:hypothetical protein
MQSAFTQGAIMIGRIFISLLLLTPFTALAQPTKSPPLGVWRGTIGTDAVVACFNKGVDFGGNRTPYGYYFYFYDSDLRHIELYKHKDNPYWYIETAGRKVAGQWELFPPTNGVITGVWRDREKTEKISPVRLTLVDGDDDKLACNRDSFISFFTQRQLRGVWRGTKGKKAIVACFNYNDSRQNGRFALWNNGSYYYITDLKPIALASGEGASWHSYSYEGDVRDVGEDQWSFSVPANGVMDGVWQDKKTGETLPVHLTLVDGGSDEKACARDSYNLRLEESIPKVAEKGKIVKFSSERFWREWRFLGQQTIELIGPDPALAQINSLLKPDQSKKALEEYFQWRRQSLGISGDIDPGELLTAWPIYWDSNFITIAFLSETPRCESCSCAPRSWNRTWDAKTGEEVDLWQWIEGSSRENSQWSQLSLKLRKFLYKQAPPEGRYYTITLGKTGLHIDDDYDEPFDDPGMDHVPKSFLVPYEKLYPFLSPAGKKAIDSILGRE